MQIQAGEKWVLLGASRGLGKAFAEVSPVPVQIWSRRVENSWDFSRQEDFEEKFMRMMQFEPSRIFYFAGGGPHGLFESKNWRDHDWSWNVNFVFPARLLHAVLRHPGSVKQITFMGSAIADADPDPLAASYCAGKHALRGLIESVRAEAPRKVDVRLFRPPYMKTDLLPANSAPVFRGEAQLPSTVAAQILNEVVS